MTHKWKTILIAALCAFAVLSTGFSLVTLHRIRELENDVSQVNQTMLHIDGEFSSAIDNAVSTIAENSKKEVSIVADHRVVWDQYSPSGMDFKVIVSPKIYQDDTEVQVRCSGISLKDRNEEFTFAGDGFEEVLAPANRLEDGIYEASFHTDLADALEITVEVKNRGVTQKEKLSTHYCGWEQKLLSPKIDGGFTQTKSSSNDKSSLEYEAYASVSAMNHYDSSGMEKGAKMESAEAVMYLNGKEISRKKIGAGQDSEEPLETEKTEGSTYTQWSADNDPSHFTWSGILEDLKEDDILDLVVVVKDDLGFTYEKQVERTVFEVKNGWIQTRTEPIWGQTMIS